MQDRFVKWLEVAPLRKTTANVIKAFTERIVYRYKCVYPEYLVPDNGTQLKSARTLLKDLRHRTTSPYTSQCNPIEH